ncbi:Sir2 family NAD-dependent protein deacetylase [Caballeronia sp. LZ062]|uniref:SIR2 family NAD-dependent protein deacylase n=1 Tax=unclassified Caballeronia TaxID=2646786 RepID=UPI002856B331|nr:MULTISPECIES: Sir2 family NAD-dependent protein deacetylase [unclassified Caballeronia]MDR5855363.1 Sir2 family NAD-dependent protein deacetylase [Caballeronia sp. LZ050]MDR5870109.1 Sir2 family NAD-dependent protein deacetylase [Caballeronia sp. LZ062]
MSDEALIEEAAEWLADADGLLVTAGAGMGVDSGLPDFRGPEGFWRAYPALRHHGFAFEDMANPDGFVRHPRLAWGFYGHRLALYRATQPHEGFHVLRRWAASMRHGAFVFTSNVDGQFQRAGFAAERVAQCHGTIHAMQCIDACTHDIWPADGFEPVVDESRCELVNALPLCPHCGRLARPNILMFGDWNWIDTQCVQQERRLAAWLAGVERLVVVELGAGRALPTVRRFSERHGPRVVRINPREPGIAPGVGVGIAGGAKETLLRLDRALNG